ncbi:CHAT domain-containing protein [Ephemerocybe angulata]|uniref:CHAT domain-containing protein n=1 Tax=Ephemerocybe angulata TaxID=980116 RepID=A0A8H6HUR8_9AGAR|nr:CHAT domain-containing protein [Tulosesus angulatus]
MDKESSVITEGREDLLDRAWEDALACSARFEETDALADIDGEIEALQRGLQIMPETHEELPWWLSDLGSSLYRRFERTGNLLDLDEAISAGQRAMQLNQEDHEALPVWTNNLRASFQARFESSGNLGDLDEAISFGRRAVQLAPEGHADLPIQVSIVGSLYQSRYDRTGDLEDLAEAISFGQRAVQLTLEGDANLPVRLYTDLAEAISLVQGALQLAPEDDEDLPIWLSNLGSLFHFRFERAGNVQDLSEAISFVQRAVRLTPEGHATLPTTLNNLGSQFQARFERTGNLADLAEAISVGQRAVRLTPEDHTDLPTRLSNLGALFYSRFQRTGDLSDLDEAISFGQQAVQLSPGGHRTLPSSLNNLASSFVSRFERTGNLEDLTESLSFAQRAVQLAPEGDAALPILLNSVGSSFRSRFVRTGNLQDIAEAITFVQRAVQLTPEGHEDLPSWLSNLGLLFQSRFERTETLGDLAEALAFAHRALELTPEGHAALPKRRYELGNSMYTWSMENDDSHKLETSLSHFKAAAISDTGPPRDRLDAAKNWAHLRHRHFPQSNDALTAFDAAIGLVALVAGLEQTIQLRYIQLQGLSGLPLEAASVACALQRPDKALEWLEQGRCLVWGQLSNLRTPLDDLRAHSEDLAQSVMEVSRRLETAGSTQKTSRTDMLLSEKISLEDEARTHLNLAQQWHDLLTTVRNIPGFETFLKPSPFSALIQYLPESGFIVVINVHENRCDAIALSAGQDRPLHVPLPTFSLEKANKYRDDLSNQLRSRQLRDRGRDEIGVLRGLWNEVVKPILDALNVSVDRSPGMVPSTRIWWCPTGPLSFLPIHAAGRYEATEYESIHDYVVSSYTPTVSALTDRVRNSRSIDQVASGLFLTSQPNAPGASPIAGTTREVRAIHEAAIKSGARVEKLEGDATTIEKCLENMESYTNVHLACHASQNAANPLQSRFLFHKGTLDLAIIIQKNLKNADLAFLSACQTSTGEEKLSDEAVHLAAGMLAAGYRRVVGTMWSIGDRHAPEVAHDFYQYLWRHGDPASGSGFDGTNSAYALHHAIGELRLRLKDNSERSLLAWIPYVHFGY